MWETTIHDTITGTFLARFTSVASSWSSSIDGSGQSTETLVPHDAHEPWESDQLASLFRPNARMLVRWWGDVPVYAHKIDSWDYDRDAGTVTVSAVDLIGETEWRMIGGVNAAKSLSLTVSGRSAAGAVRAVLGRMMSWGAPWVYPIDLPADGPGDFTASWVFWEKYRISDLLGQIADMMGVEIFLRPYAVSGGVRFQTVVAPKITTGETRMHLDADESPLSGVHYRVDGKRQVTGLLGVGNGTGEDQETRSDENVILIPIRDTKQSFPDLTGDALQDAVSVYYHAHTSPLVQWSVGGFALSDDWPVVHVLPGRVWALESHGDPVIPDGVHSVRVINVSGGSGLKLSVEVQDG